MPQMDLRKLHRAGERVKLAPEGIASKPFWVETLVAAAHNGPGAMIATLEPGTVTHWHSHPDGQILYVLSGVGLVQRDNSPVEELRAGDCISFDPGERHWHGATPTTTFAYISFQATRDGSAATWFEPVTAGDSR
jgi:quercetin dioxygenase-like cupin family protein